MATARRRGRAILGGLALVGLLALMATALLVSVPRGHGAHASPTVIATVPVGGESFGVGVNASTDRVYVPNTDSDTVSIIDGASNAVIATVPVGDHQLGVGVNASTDRVYVGNFLDDTVSVIADPAALPTTGGYASGGSGLPWLAVAIGAAIVTGSGLLFAYQRRRVC